tara:strand:+ start:1106 stop:2266 length:1161 start_codon:yes stop_codon:yes gene_type:complete
LIPYSTQTITEEDVKAVLNVLNSKFLTQGPKIPSFEKIVTQYCGSNYGVAVNSATSALHIACIALGLKEGDLLWTSPNSYVASANCALYCGAEVDFVDIDPLTYNLCPIKLEEKLVKAKKNNRVPKIVVPVHFAGQPCDMKEIKVLSKKYGFKILEDASHSIGAEYKGKRIGACEFSDITVFSFHAVKIITTGEGGMAITNDFKLFKSMQLLRSHGVTRDLNLMKGKPHGKWYYQQIDLGFNYRITEMQAALGISQMKSIDKNIKKRHILKDRYDKTLENFPIQIPYNKSSNYSSLHLYPIQIRKNSKLINRKKVFDKLVFCNIGVNVHYIPIHTQPYYKKMGFKESDFPASVSYYNNALSLPLFPNMTTKEQDKVIEALNYAFKY